MTYDDHTFRLRTPRRPGLTGRAARTGKAVATAVLLILTVGCGIQSTSVPVDAGAAPSRIACVMSDRAQSAPNPQDTVVRVYLHCGSRVSPVQRSVPLPEGRVAVARQLLETLAAEPDAAERAAGFSSRVPAGLQIHGGGPSDPPGTLRLSTSPEDLPPFAYAQIVCTLAETEAASPTDRVVVAGPADSASPQPRRVACTAALRNRAEAAATAGEPVTP